MSDFGADFDEVDDLEGFWAEEDEREFWPPERERNWSLLWCGAFVMVSLFIAAVVLAVVAS